MFLVNSAMAIDRDETREKVLSYLISMTVQLKYLLVERFEYLLHVVQYVSYVTSVHIDEYAVFSINS